MDSTVSVSRQAPAGIRRVPPVGGAMIGLPPNACGKSAVSTLVGQQRLEGPPRGVPAEAVP